MFQWVAQLFVTPEYAPGEARAVRRNQRWELDSPELLWTTVGVRR